MEDVVERGLPDELIKLAVEQYMYIDPELNELISAFVETTEHGGDGDVEAFREVYKHIKQRYIGLKKDLFLLSD